MKRMIKVIVIAAMAAFSPLAFGHGGGGGGHGGGGGGGHGGGFGGGGHGGGYHGGGYGYYGGGYYGGFYGYPGYWSPYYYGYPGYGYGYGNGYYGDPRYYYGRRSYNRSRHGERVYAGQSVEVGVQVALARRGYYRSAIDGQAGQQTRSAIRRYQRDRRLAVTGAIDRSLLRSLGI